MLFFIASDFTSITSHIHNWVLFLLWLHLFILSGVISPLFSNSILGTYGPREFFFQCHTFFLFILFMGFSRQEYWSGLPFPPPVDHVLSELSTMTHPSWVALHSIAHSYIELDKTMIQVISLVQFSSVQSLSRVRLFATPWIAAQLFACGGQSTGASASASVLPKKSQGWSPSEWTDWISLQSKGLSRVFSNTTVQKHQFFGTQPSSQSNSHIHTWLLEKP